MLDKFINSPEAPLEMLNGFLQESLSHCGNSVWEDLLDLLNHPYWTRLWIIQEIGIVLLEKNLSDGRTRAVKRLRKRGMD